MTNSYYVELSFDMGEPQDPEDFERHVDSVSEAFADLVNVDGDVGANLKTGRIDLCITLTAEDHATAVTTAVTAARTAVHCAGGATPGWESMLASMLDDNSYGSTITRGDLKV